MTNAEQQKIFPVQEIGSITKPGWRVKGVSNASRIGKREIEEAEFWGSKLSVPNYQELIGLLRSRERSKVTPSDEEKKKIKDWSVRYVLKLLENAGLDIIYSGEQWRVEMYEHAVQGIGGFALLGSVQSFDNKYYTKGAVVSTPQFVKPAYLDELAFVQKETDKEIKVPITGPYTIVDWSFNEFYENALRSGQKVSDIDMQKIYFSARKEFMLDLIKNVLRKDVEILVKQGAKRIDIDEPAITTKPNKMEMALFARAINELTEGFTDITFGLHNCYSDYSLLAKYLPKLRDIKQVTLEFANHDSADLGVNPASRPGYADLSVLNASGYKGSYGLGVVHVHDYVGHTGNGAVMNGKDIIESPELVRDRILYAADVVGDPYKISVNPDCGLRTRSWEVIYSKLKAMSEGAALAREKFE